MLKGERFATVTSLILKQYSKSGSREKRFKMRMTKKRDKNGVISEGNDQSGKRSWETKPSKRV